MTKETNKSISDYRDQIDVIDQEIINLMNERLDVAAKIAEIKNEQQNPILSSRA